MTDGNANSCRLVHRQSVLSPQWPRVLVKQTGEREREREREREGGRDGESDRHDAKEDQIRR